MSEGVDLLPADIALRDWKPTSLSYLVAFPLHPSLFQEVPADRLRTANTMGFLKNQLKRLRECVLPLFSGGFGQPHFCLYYLGLPSNFPDSVCHTKIQSNGRKKRAVL